MSNFYMSNFYMSNFYMSNFYMSNFYMSNFYMSNFYMSNYYMSNFYMSNSTWQWQALHSDWELSRTKQTFLDSWNKWVYVTEHTVTAVIYDLTILIINR